MFDFIAPTPDRRRIRDGRVHCPMRGSDLDVDACIECGWVGSIYRRQDGEGFVLCRPGFISEELTTMRQA